ncbi:hypothetical protein [Nocardia sp. NBC_01388]|uniref:hypothetical protein n=1 Tax=Nocardia sp. NBC_01388 TaxID=2903596 RepID=UPI003254CEE0
MSPEPVVTVTRYEVSCLPEEHRDRRSFSMSVAYRGGEKWCVTDTFECYDLDGHPSFEGRASCRDDAWSARHWFDLVTALALANRLAPAMRVNGQSVADVLARGGGQ